MHAFFSLDTIGAENACIYFVMILAVSLVCGCIELGSDGHVCVLVALAANCSMD